MAKIKLNIELDEKYYEALKKLFNDQKTMLGLSSSTIENFLENILISFIKSSEEMKNMEGKMADLIKMFGDGFGDFDLGGLFGKFSNKKKTEEKKNDDKNKNLKS